MWHLGYLQRALDSVGPRNNVTKLIRKGVPIELRGRVWWRCSGAKYKKENTPEELQFENLVDIAMRKENSSVHQDIEKDLHRTFPTNANFEKEEGINALRRVLLAYSVRNPRVGYCQSMNFLTAILLLHMDEEKAFWVLAAIVENLLPEGYYTHDMRDSRVDQRVLMSAIKSKFPRLHDHLASLAISLEPITCAWFLCVFVNALPLEVTLRIWDCFLHEGSKVIFRVGLAIFKRHEAELLKASDFGEVYQLLRNPLGKPPGADALPSGTGRLPSPSHQSVAEFMQCAFDKVWLGSFKYRDIEKSREEHRAKMLRESDYQRLNRTKYGSLSSSFGEDNMDSDFVLISPLDDSPLRRLQRTREADGEAGSEERRLSIHASRMTSIDEAEASDEGGSEGGEGAADECEYANKAMAIKEHPCSDDVDSLIPGSPQRVPEDKEKSEEVEVGEEVVPLVADTVCVEASPSEAEERDVISETLPPSLHECMGSVDLSFDLAHGEADEESYMFRSALHSSHCFPSPADSDVFEDARSSADGSSSSSSSDDEDEKGEGEDPCSSMLDPPSSHQCSVPENGSFLSQSNPCLDQEEAVVGSFTSSSSFMKSPIKKGSALLLMCSGGDYKDSPLVLNEYFTPSAECPHETEQETPQDV